MTDALTWRPDAASYLARLDKLAEAAAASGIHAVLLSPGADTLYYVGRDQGSHERLTALVVRPGKQPLLIVPALEWPGWSSNTVASSLDAHPWSDGESPYANLGALLGPGLHVAVDDHLPAMHVLGLQEALSPSSVSLAGRLTAHQRAHKDAHEAAAMLAVAAANDRIQQRIGEWLRPGRTEAEVAADIAGALIDEGHVRADFVIVGSGPHGASPHHTASDRVIQDGDCVVIDIGGPAASGYNSDSTRTYSVGAPSDPEFQRVHDIVREAQEAGVQAAVAGATCESVDAASRAVIQRAGYGEFFITRTGHGIGLEVHEHPYIVRGNTQVLEPGMVFSVEPGIYLPGRFGVRIEDIVIVDAAGAPQRLNNSPRGWQF